MIRISLPCGMGPRLALAALALAAIACPVEPVQAAGADAQWYDGRWPHERSSELPPHPDALFGRLDNGLRYVVLPNAKPEGRVHLSLDVQAGSLMEGDDELGLAHFVEHMAFNGTRNFPPGALIPFLQRHGMGFGGDVNAHTAHTETVYTLDLSSAGEDEVATGLRVLRDVADGMLMAPAEVDKERGVVLAEKSARDSEKSRQGRHYRQTVFAGTRFVNDPIGDEDVLRSADASRLRHFYDAWYRPERMILVVVGQVDRERMRALIESHFADLRGRGAAPAVAWWGDIRHEGVRAFIRQGPDSGLTVSVSAIQPRRHEADSVKVQRGQVLDALAREMFQTRLSTRATAADAPFLGARAALAPAFGLFPGATLSASCVAGRWRDCVSALEQELRTAVQFGFTAQEFEDARRLYRARFDALVRQRANRTSKDIAAEIVDTLNADRVYQSEEQTRALYLGLLDDIDRPEVEAAFRRAWDSGNRLIFADGNVDVTPADLEAAWKQAAGMAATPPRPAQAGAFPYLPEPTQAAAIAEDRREAVPGSSLERRTVRLANGVTLHLLPTPFEKGRLSLSFLFGGGLGALSDEDHALAVAAGKTLREGGIGALSRDEVRRLLGWRELSVAEGYREETFAITAAGRREDQDLVLTALWTQFTDPTLRDEERQRMLEAQRRGRAERLSSVDGGAQVEGERFLFGGARRDDDFLDEAVAANIGLGAMRAFLARTRGAGPRTLVAVGDFDPQALVERAALLFGALGAPIDGQNIARKPAFPEGQARTVNVPDKLRKAAVTLAWRRDLEDEGDQDALAVRRLLAAAITDRLRERVREELGAAYSPAARYRHDLSLNGYGMFQMAIKMDSALLERVRDAAREVAAGLARDGMPAGTAERLRAPMLAEWNAARGQNRYWQRQLEWESLRGLPYLAWAAKQPDRLRQVSDDDLSREAMAVFARPAAELSVVGGEVAP